MTTESTEFVFWVFGTPRTNERRLLTKVRVRSDALVIEGPPVVTIPLTDISTCRLDHTYGGYTHQITAKVLFKRPQPFYGTAKGIGLLLADPTAPLFENPPYEPEYEAFAAVINVRIAGGTPTGIDPNPYRRTYQSKRIPVSAEHVPDAHLSPMIHNPQSPPNYGLGFLISALVLGVLLFIAIRYGMPVHSTLR